jgi:SAM-dependent methyltransferase
MSSQVFEYLDDVAGGLAEIFRVLKPGGRALIHDTDWGTTLLHSSNPGRMARILEIWDDHLADPHLPQTLGRKLADAGFTNVTIEAIVQIDTKYDRSSVSTILLKFVGDYAISQGITQEEADAWMDDLKILASRGDFFCSWTEYIFTACKS